MPWKIALISEHASPLAQAGGVDSGGQNIYVAKLAAQLAAAGHEVDVFTRRDRDDVGEVVALAPRFRVVNVPAGPACFVRKEELLPFMSEFASFVRRFALGRGGYDLAHANFFMSGLVAAELKRALGVPFVVTFHALGLVRRHHQGAADGFPAERCAIERYVMDEADAVIAECPQDFADLVTLYGAERHKIVVIPCGFDPREFWPIAAPFARKTLGLAPRERVILQLGRLVPRKGTDDAVRGTARLIREHGYSAKLLVVGGESDVPDPKLTPEIGRLKRIAADEGIERHVIFVGRRSRELLKLYYGAADVFVTTPWYEPFGITPLEAMACGTPVIGSAVGGIKYSVVDNVTGFLVPPKDPDTLGRRLAELYADAELRKQLARQAAQRARRFTWSAVGRSVETLYAHVAAGTLPAEAGMAEAA